MLGRWFNQLGRPAVFLLGVCGIGIVWNKYFKRDMSNRAVEPPKKASPPISKLTRQSIGTAAAAAAAADFSKNETLADFGYEFTAEGEFRNIKSGDKFEFKVSEDQKVNQKRYEIIGEKVTEVVYEMLEKEGKLERVQVPVDANPDEATSFIFASEDYERNSDKLMVLIHGSGVVRAGQWARRLIINDNIKHGTQLPYIKRAQQEGYAVLVLNTNLNFQMVNGEKKYIRGNNRPEEHGTYVWKEIISKLPAKHIAIVAHSYGGIVTTHMAREFADEFDERVFAVAFTDSVHSLEWQQAPESVHTLYQQRAQNWVASDDPLDKPVRTPRKDAPCVSAGHDTHEWTSSSALQSVFTFFSKKYPAASSDL